MRWRIFFFQAEDGIRDYKVTGVQTCALPILDPSDRLWIGADVGVEAPWQQGPGEIWAVSPQSGDRKSTRLNSSHLVISYAVFCLKKKNTPKTITRCACPSSFIATSGGTSHPT